jgi:hypothetical protein
MKNKTNKGGEIEIDDAFMESLADNPPTHCPHCKRKLNYKYPENDKSPELYRVDKGKGYVPGNVERICYRCFVERSQWELPIMQVAAIMRRNGQDPWERETNPQVRENLQAWERETDCRIRENPSAWGG